VGSRGLPIAVGFGSVSGHATEGPSNRHPQATTQRAEISETRAICGLREYCQVVCRIRQAEILSRDILNYYGNSMFLTPVN